MADFVVFFAPAASVFWLAAVRLLLKDILTRVRLCVLLWINYSLALFLHFLNQRSDLGGFCKSEVVRKNQALY